jgi:hypothetical protein
MRWAVILLCVVVSACTQRQEVLVSGTPAPITAPANAPPAPSVYSAPRVQQAPALAESARPAKPSTSSSRQDGPTDRAIAQVIVTSSRSSYSGSCPCPDNVDRAGRRCGGRSAYSRPGGHAPLCYESDVNAQMIAEFRTKMATAR